MAERIHRKVDLRLRHRFFGKPKPIDWLKLATELHQAGMIEAPFDDDLPSVLDAVSIEAATYGHLSFALSAKSLEPFSEKSSDKLPSLVVVSSNLHGVAAKIFDNNQTAILLSKWPRVAFGKIVEAIYPTCLTGWQVNDWDTQSASIAKTAKIAPSAQIGSGAEIADDCEIGPNAVIGPNVVLGAGCRVGPNAVLMNVMAGERCNFLAHSVVGERGYGVALAPPIENDAPASAYELPQIGGVRIGNRCEIRHFACVDRGSLSDTILGDDVHVDSNSVIGHSSMVGDRVSLGAFTGLGGNSVIGDNCVLWARCAVQEGRTLGPNSELKYGSIVTKDFLAGGECLKGDPAMPLFQWQRRMAAMGRIAKP